MIGRKSVMEGVAWHLQNFSFAQAGAQKSILSSGSRGIIERKNTAIIGKVDTQISAGDEFGFVCLLHLLGIVAGQYVGIGIGYAAIFHNGFQGIPVDDIIADRLNKRTKICFSHCIVTV